VGGFPLNEAAVILNGAELREESRQAKKEMLRGAQNEKTIEPLAKLPINNHCHSERSEESCISSWLRSFTPFRMTEKRLLQEAQ
jgi:hypothetical protein